MPIIVLPIHLVNKIAAGEVIERPSSVVKELVENAIDAGATRIDVRLEDGGRRLISVADNGCGISGDDLALAFASHATSKIANEDDLFNIMTMGFRGEALASIASVSHAQMRSRRQDAAETGGYEVEAAGGEIGPVRPCAAGEGTTVTVRDLFCNTPARRKFLRTANTELGHASDHLARLALAHPTIAFSLAHNGKAIQALAATDSILQRVGDLFGADLAGALLPIVPRRGPVQLGGLLATVAAARASAKWQYFFLNKRFIRDRLLAHALREAYRGLLDPSLSPVAFVFLELPPSEVDVNVHPTKIEVRFRDGQAVYGELLAALRETLNKAELAPTARLSQAVDERSSPADQQRRESLRQALADFFKSSPAHQPGLEFPSASARGDELRRGHPGRPADPPPWATASAQERPSARAGQGEAPTIAPAPAGARPPAASPAAMQVNNTYIVSASQEGLLIIDQHALHERLIYNDLRRSLETGRLSGQRLLIPQGFRVTTAEADCLARHAELLERLGIEVAPFAPATWAVQQFPSMLIERGVDAGGFMRRLVDKLSDSDAAELSSASSLEPTSAGSVEPERLLSEVLEMLACQAAVKAGQPLAPAEIDALLARRQEAENASACPHGRPTVLRLTLRDLQRQFMRT
jgi:DNA mismatch repair protein MutL